MALGNAGVPARTVPNLLHLLFRNQFSRSALNAGGDARIPKSLYHGTSNLMYL